MDLEKDEINFLRLIRLEIGPLILAPRGVSLFFNKIKLFLLNLIKDPSFLKILNLVLIKILLCLLFFFIEFSGTTSLQEIFKKSPTNAKRPLDPLYK